MMAEETSPNPSQDQGAPALAQTLPTNAQLLEVDVSVNDTRFRPGFLILMSHRMNRKTATLHIISREFISMI